MSRSGYVDDNDDVLMHGRWRGIVASAMRGKRGQRLLREAIAALDAMPEKELVADSLVTQEGDYCTLGVVGAARGIDMTNLDPEDPDAVGKAFDISPAMVSEIVYFNDETGWDYVEVPWVKRNWSDHPRTVRREETPAERWTRMRAWLESKLTTEAK